MKAHQLLLITFCGFLACNLFDWTSAASNNISHKGDYVTFGHCGPYARIIQKERVYKKAKWLRVVEEQRTLHTNGPKISCVIANNFKHNGHPAKVLLASGGENFNHTTLRFVSERGHGIHFDVELWGY